jgi:glycolate oxidase FAD binding subunit
VRVCARSPVYHQEATRVLERLRSKAQDCGGSLIVERAPVEIKREFDSWGSFGSSSDVMKRVKQQLDPPDVLSPGRFF